MIDNYILPEFKVIDENEEQNKILVEMSPLEGSLAITIGNAIRRVCLSEIPGLAMTSVRYDKVTHEFCAIDGVIEDVLTINLNLRKIVFKSPFKLTNNESVKFNLQFHPKKIGKIFATDIKLPGGITILNPDLYICEITKTNPFKAEIVVESGRGYHMADRVKKLSDDIHMISCDANFSPVTNVSYETQSVRIGETKKYEKLKIKLSTNGTINAYDTLSEAANCLINHFDALLNWTKRPRHLIFEEESQEIVNESQTILNKEIEYFDLTARTYNALKKHGIDRVGKLINLTERELLNLSSLGDKSIEELKLKVKNLGFKFKDSI